ncbi:MAG: CRISPR-associated protein [Paludibacteraceae bacterium]|nr:CRISPR-associated protein [Paludibacteraceae bacterium]
MTKSFFLNLSNHPSSKWTVQQITAAKEVGEIIDWTFPQIDPLWPENQISLLADDYYKKIVDLCPKPANITIHLMGEMSFCYALVSRLSTKGYTCVASTTERIVVDRPDGVKEVKFQFVQFRKYIGA